MGSTPIIALTMGDPSGIGPEVIVKAFQDDTLPLQSRAVVIGDARLLQETAKKYAPEILIIPSTSLKKAVIRLAPLMSSTSKMCLRISQLANPVLKQAGPVMKLSKPLSTLHSATKSQP